MFKLFRKRMKNHKGFTLVELMVVVLIIGILVAIAIPAYNKVTENAETQACKANKRTIEGALQVYKADNNGDLPTAEQFPGFLRNDSYFPSEPKCPAGGKYQYVNGVVSCSEHVDSEQE